MEGISRRQAVRGAATAAAAMALGAPSIHAENGRQTLRFVAHADLKVLDPVWTTAYITRNHGYLVYDTLFGTDENLQVQPQMVDRTTVSPDGMKYTFTLRDGLRWHDGQPVLSEDCVESLKRWGRVYRFGQLLMAHTAKIAPVDKKTFTLELAERFGPVLDALGSQRPPFMMPARIAATPAEEQIKEIVGSGPFKFARDEWQPGEQVVYVRNPEYIPRDEPASGSAGGKKVYLDKVIWRYIPDPWDAANDFAAGEVDWWEQPPLDFIPKIEQNPALQTLLTDPLGTQGWLRPNCLHPPFNNKKAREALLHMMDQVTYLALAIGQSQYYRPCYSVFACGGPYANEDRCRADHGARPHESEAAGKGVGLRWPSDCGAPRHRHSVPQRRSDRHAPTAGLDRLQRHPQGDGLVNESDRAGTQGTARERRLESTSHLVSGSRGHQSRRTLRCLGCRTARLVWLAGCPATRQARYRLGARDRSNETPTARRRGPEGRSQRSDVCAVGRMGPADGLPKECQGYPQVRSADFLELEDQFVSPSNASECLLRVKTRIPPERSHVSFRRMQTLGQAAGF
jgi:Bacterial extracellular solute-binding proteins, family 5 Middle